MKSRLQVFLVVLFIFLAGIALRYAPHSFPVRGDFQSLAAAQSSGDPQGAALALANIAEQLPWRPALWETAGDFALAAGDRVLAQSAFEKAYSRNSLSREGKLTLGEIYLQDGSRDSAEEMWQEIRAYPPAAYRLAILKQEEGDIPGAISEWQNLLSLDGRDPAYQAEYNLGLLLAAHDPPSALPHLEQSLDNHPALDALINAIQGAHSAGDPAYLLLVSGQKLASLGKWSLALHAFQQAVNLRQDYGEAWAYLGEARQRVGPSAGDPLEALQNALELSPESPAVNTFLGLYWRRQGEPEKALEFFQVTAELVPDLPETYQEIGRTLAVMGDLEGAREQYERAVNTASDREIYLCALARFTLEYNYRVRDVGLPAVRQALIEKPSSPDALNTMGEILVALGDQVNAQKMWYRALEEKADYIPAHLNLGKLFLLLEDEERAAYHFYSILSTSTDDAIIKQVKSYLGLLSTP